VVEHAILIGSVTLIHLLAVMSPGPDFVVVMKQSLSYSRKTGIWTSVGVGTGIMVHILYCVLGLGLVIANSSFIYDIIKYAGAAYLLYLGVQSILAKVKDVQFEKEMDRQEIPSAFKSFQIGFLTNVLNPKATLFFLSLFTLVIAPDTPTLIMIILSIILVVNTMLWFILLSYIITIEKIRTLFNKFQYHFNLVFGILLILVAVKVAFF
jgi:RhtB (resistance to homoserine/threonine) family protein